MPKAPMTEEQQAHYDAMLADAAVAVEELRQQLTQDPNTTAVWVIQWLQRHYLACSYKHLVQGAFKVIKELRL